MQGELEITTVAGTGRTAVQAGGDGKEHVEKVPFLMLGLDLPPAPLYKDKDKKDIIPQVPLSSLSVDRDRSAFLWHRHGRLFSSRPLEPILRWI